MRAQKEAPIGEEDTPRCSEAQGTPWAWGTSASSEEPKSRAPDRNQHASLCQGQRVACPGRRAVPTWQSMTVHGEGSTSGEMVGEACHWCHKVTFGHTHGTPGLRSHLQEAKASGSPPGPAGPNPSFPGKLPRTGLAPASPSQHLSSPEMGHASICVYPHVILRTTLGREHQSHYTDEETEAAQ